MKLYHFPERVQRRCCASCAIPLPRLAPTWHRHCRQCYGYSTFRRAVDVMLDATRPGR